jgi:hypothetical protein
MQLVTTPRLPFALALLLVVVAGLARRPGDRLTPPAPTVGDPPIIEPHVAAASAHVEAPPPERLP